MPNARRRWQIIQRLSVSATSLCCCCCCQSGLPVDSWSHFGWSLEPSFIFPLFSHSCFSLSQHTHCIICSYLESAFFLSPSFPHHHFLQWLLLYVIVVIHFPHSSSSPPAVMDTRTHVWFLHLWPAATTPRVTFTTTTIFFCSSSSSALSSPPFPTSSNHHPVDLVHPIQWSPPSVSVKVDHHHHHHVILSFSFVNVTYFSERVHRLTSAHTVTHYSVFFRNQPFHFFQLLQLFLLFSFSLVNSTTCQLYVPFRSVNFSAHTHTVAVAGCCSQLATTDENQ